MNDIFLYEYKNKLQFLSTASPFVLIVYTEWKDVKANMPLENPKVIGRWRYKKMTGEMRRLSKCLIRQFDNKINVENEGNGRKK